MDTRVEAGSVREEVWISYSSCTTHNSWQTYSKKPTRNLKAYSALYDSTRDVQIVAIPQPTSREGMTQRGDTLVNRRFDGIWPMTYPTVQIDVPTRLGKHCLEILGQSRADL